jgi:hypothetical protein
MADEIIQPEPTQDPQPDTSAAQAAELERMRVALKAANKEAADRRKRLEELEAAEQARKTAEMTELDKARAEAEQARKDIAEARAGARTALIRAAFVAEAAKVGATHPDDVHRLADLAGVDVDESGTVTGVAEAVKSLVDAGRVPLVGRQIAPKLDGGAGGGDRSQPQVKLTADELEIARKMNITPEKFAANKVALTKRQE